MKRGASSLGRATKRRKTAPRRQATMAIYGRKTGISEVKSFDGAPTGAALPLSAAVAGGEPGAAFAGITHVNCVPQGATVANRIGNKIMMKSIHLKGTISAAAAVLSNARVMLIYDKQPNGAFPTFADIITDQPGGVSGFYSSLNIANKSRFSVIRDQFFNFDPAQSLQHTINWYCKGRWETEYGANGGTVADFRTGAIFLVALYTVAVVNMSNLSVRTRYFD